jgi:hypothetical protein
MPKGASARAHRVLLVAIVLVAAIALWVAILPNFTYMGACPSPPGRTLDGSLSLRPHDQSATSRYTDHSWSVPAACNGLTWSDLSSVVEVVENSTTGTPVTSGWSLLGQTPSAVTIVTYEPIPSAWVGPSTQLIQVGDLFAWETTGYLSNASLDSILNGTGQFSGSLSWCACGI